MNTKLVVVLAVVLLAALVVDAASTKDRKNNKGDKGGKKDNKGGNKDNKKGGKNDKNVCLPVEGALKKAGFELCKLKLDKVEAMLERADELECFDWLVEEAMDKMKEMKDNMTRKDRGDKEEGEDDDEPAMDKAKEAGDDEEDEGDEDRAGKGKGNKKNKKGKKDKKNKGDDDGEWEVDFEDLDIDDLMEEFGVDFDMLKNMKMRDIIRELGPCKRCKDDGCLRVNHWIGSKMMLVRDIIGMVEEWGGCPEMSSKQEEGTTAGRLPGP